MRQSSWPNVVPETPNFSGNSVCGQRMAPVQDRCRCVVESPVSAGLEDGRGPSSGAGGVALGSGKGALCSFGISAGVIRSWP